MTLAEYVDEERVLDSLKAGTKDDILKELVDYLDGKNLLKDRDKTLNALLEREKLSSTGVGEEVAIPHAKLPDIDDIIILVALSREGVDFDSSDGRDVKIFFLVLAPEKQMNLHLKTLARISRLIKASGFKEKALAAGSSAEVCSILAEEDAGL
ncbi:PTS sugar transporter subunit IIA [Limisalsivibrio acetivorans]|uniref:PTS sugar transporter subunit IIA n=1 Tax=Limisalsivibrio acetivorans TaxID=1304888 RepID=UPI0003B6F17A|nr:PTS sugar transporter subunit IIA [Limisalsivibrio acetivorans]